MERLTEYHSGVAVIKGKRFSEAARKLAAYEDAEEGCDMEKITTEFAEYICDMVCGNLDDVRKQEDADRICDECKLGKYICDICNCYGSLNTFVGSQTEMLMMENAKLKKALAEMEK